MAELQGIYFGEMVDYEPVEGKRFIESKKKFVGRTGMILTYTSQNMRPGDEFIYFYPNADDAGNAYLHTSCGKVDINSDGNNFRNISIKTDNSIYKFKENNRLSDDQKDNLCLDIFGCKLVDIKKE